MISTLITLVGVLLQLSYWWIADRACRRGKHRALRGLLSFFLFAQLILWLRIEWRTSATMPSVESIFTAAALVWTIAIVPLALLGAAGSRWRGRRAAAGAKAG